MRNRRFSPFRCDGTCASPSKYDIFGHMSICTHIYCIQRSGDNGTFRGHGCDARKNRSIRAATLVALQRSGGIEPAVDAQEPAMVWLGLMPQRKQGYGTFMYNSRRLLETPTMFCLLNATIALDYGLVEIGCCVRELAETLWLAMKNDTRPEQERCDTIEAVYQIVSMNSLVINYAAFDHILEMLHSRHVN